MDNYATVPLVLFNRKESNAGLAFELLILIVGTTYVVNYGELSLSLPFIPNVPAAIVAGIPALTAYTFCMRVQGNRGSRYLYWVV